MAGAGGASQSNQAGFDRFRSFAERYVIERTASFSPGAELEGAWRAIQDAKKIYCMIAEAKSDVDNPGAHRGEGVAAPPPVHMLHGMPLFDVIEDMKKAGVPMAVIQQYVKDAMAGKMVPLPQNFIAATGGQHGPQARQGSSPTKIV